MQQFDLEIEKKECHKDYILSYSKILCQKRKKGFGKQKKTPFAGKNPKLWLTALEKYDKIPYCQRINLKGLSPGSARFAPVAQLERATAFYAVGQGFESLQARQTWGV